MSEPKQREFMFSYRYLGAEYCFTVPAVIEEEARERVSQMHFATCDGEVLATIHATRLGRLHAWWQGESS